MSVVLKDVAENAVDKLSRAFGKAVPTGYEIDYRLSLDLGGTFGIARVLVPLKKYEIVLNPHLMLRATEHETIETVEHEIAHVFDHLIVRHMGHGASWKMLMMILGYEQPKACHNISTAGLRGKREKAAAWCLDCGKHVAVTMTQKERLLRGRTIRKTCFCGGELYARP